MTTAIILIIVAVITLLSLLLKFSNLAKENVSIFLDIKKRNEEIRQMISELKNDNEKRPTYKRFWLSISDWFSGLAILLISFRLIMEYVSTEYMTRATVFHIGLFFSLLLFNLIFLSISIMERRLGYWIDEFMSIIGHMIEIIRTKDTKEESLKPNRIKTRLRPTTKKRIARLNKK
jgi:hypothetical protein